MYKFEFYKMTFLQRLIYDKSHKGTGDILMKTAILHHNLKRNALEGCFKCWQAKKLKYSDSFQAALIFLVISSDSFAAITHYLTP